MHIHFIRTLIIEAGKRIAVIHVMIECYWQIGNFNGKLQDTDHRILVLASINSLWVGNIKSLIDIPPDKFVPSKAPQPIKKFFLNRRMV